MEEEIAGTSSTEEKSSLSNAEQLRQRRRQKILANQDSRMGKILGTDSSGKNKAKTEDPPSPSYASDEPAGAGWGSLSRPGESIEELEVDDGVTIIRRTKNQKVSFEESGSELPKSEFPKNESKSPLPKPSSSATQVSSSSKPQPQTPTGFMVTQPDGSTLHPKLSASTCRILVSMLGACLSLFNARFFMITFFSWEVAVFAINGLPEDEAPSSSFVLLIALLGIKDAQLKRLKFVLKLSNCIVTDFSILLVSSLVIRVLYQNFVG